MNALQRFGLNGKNLLEFAKNMFVGDARDVSMNWYNADDSVTTYTYPNFPKQRETAQQHFATIENKLPIQPNLWKNTKNFAWTDKQKGVLYDNALPDNWGWHNYNDGDTQFKAMVIDSTDIATINSLGVEDPIHNIPLLTGNIGNDVSILYLEITKTKGGTTLMNQDSARYTDWRTGNFSTGARAYFCVVEATGDISFRLANRVATIGIDKNDAGKGWQKKVNHKVGFGGAHQGYLEGAGTIKFAIALPYSYVGYIQEAIDAWCGFVGSNTAYTHKDLIGGV